MATVKGRGRALFLPSPVESLLPGDQKMGLKGSFGRVTSSWGCVAKHASPTFPF